MVWTAQKIQTKQKSILLYFQCNLTGSPPWNYFSHFLLLNIIRVFFLFGLRPLNWVEQRGDFNPGIRHCTVQGSSSSVSLWMLHQSRNLHILCSALCFCFYSFTSSFNGRAGESILLGRRRSTISLKVFTSPQTPIHVKIQEAIIRSMPEKEEGENGENTWVLQRQAATAVSALGKSRVEGDMTLHLNRYISSQ